MSKNQEITSFWESNPCGENLTSKKEDWLDHFQNYDGFRYETEGHILVELDKIDLQDKALLEIGVGQAADSMQMVLRGADWHGLDPTEAAILRAKMRFQVFELGEAKARQGSATQIPWPDNSFDIIYSHGVLHHIPDIQRVVKEINRVLRPGGSLIIMCYHKNSFNYYLSIMFIRRTVLILLYCATLGGRIRLLPSLANEHIDNARKFGLWHYLQSKNFLNANTDGPQNPYSVVYTPKSIARVFDIFKIDAIRVHFLNLRHLPLLRLLPNSCQSFLAHRFGWHLWAIMQKEDIL